MQMQTVGTNDKKLQLKVAIKFRGGSGDGCSCQGGGKNYNSGTRERQSDFLS